MKSKAGGLVFVIAVLSVSAALFLPLNFLDPALAWTEISKDETLLSFLAWLLLATGFLGFKVRFWSSDARDWRKLANCALLVVLQAVLLRTCFELAKIYSPLLPIWLPQDFWAWVPWFLMPGLTGILLGSRLGIVVCGSGTMLLYLLADPGPWPLAGSLVGPLSGILLLRRCPTRNRVLRAGSGAGAVVGFVTAAFYGVNGASLDALSAAVLVPVAVGFLSAFLVLAVLPVLEWVLGELSDVTLQEYNSDHALLDQLRMEAPGTWYHSLNVADLAERAAAAVGARALFCKTAALYHDIGKLKDPGLFAENLDDCSPHDSLDPQVSAQKIIEHVPYGIELARKHRLPKPFIEIIAEHHGISLVRYFYAKASAPMPDGTKPKVDRSLFCYPGPSPSTVESGIIALADAVEAASRSFASRSEQELQAFVRHLVADRISEGELAECPLRLADLARIQAAFVGWLKGRNHYRPAYPGFGNALAAPVKADAVQPAGL